KPQGQPSGRILGRLGGIGENHPAFPANQVVHLRICAVVSSEDRPQRTADRVQGEVTVSHPEPSPGVPCFFRACCQRRISSAIRSSSLAIASRLLVYLSTSPFSLACLTRASDSSFWTRTTSPHLSLSNS